MAEDARKKKILDHLNLSGGGVKYTSPTARGSSLPATPGVTPSPFEPDKPIRPPAPAKGDRKNRIMDHLNRSSDDFRSLVDDSERQKKQQIQNHLKKSQG